MMTRAHSRTLSCGLLRMVPTRFLLFATDFSRWFRWLTNPLLPLSRPVGGREGGVNESGRYPPTKVGGKQEFPAKPKTHNTTNDHTLVDRIEKERHGGTQARRHARAERISGSRGGGWRPATPNQGLTVFCSAQSCNTTLWSPMSTRNTSGGPGWGAGAAPGSRASQRAAACITPTRIRVRIYSPSSASPAPSASVPWSSGPWSSGPWSSGPWSSGPWSSGRLSRSRRVSSTQAPVGSKVR